MPTVADARRHQMQDVVEMIVAGEECKKLIKIDKRILRAREDAIREILDALYNRIIRLQAKTGKSYADVLDIIYEYRRAFLGESAKSRTKFPASEIDWRDDTGTREFIEYQRRKALCVCPHPGHLCGDCSISGGNK